MTMQIKQIPYHNWLEAIVVVEFDLDQGQKVMLAVPQSLSPRKDKEVSMLAFPDSNSCSENETLYKYIFKTSEQELAFVCFKQKKDITNKRGYAQKSFVVLTRLPFLSFFEKLAEFMVFKLYNLEQVALREELQRIFNQSKEWPDPEPLSRYQLPVLDYSINALLPNYLYNSGTGFIKAENFPNNFKKQKPTSIEEGVMQEVSMQLGRFQQVRLTEVFGGREEQLWTIWESAMLNRAILLMAQTPYMASQAVLAGASLTNPIEYAGELHPYVTVYDSHLNELQLAQSDVLLGATNPLFSKLFSKGKVEILQVGAIKVKKHLKPVRQLFLTSNHEHHKLVNESALRKYFYRINCNITAVLEQYLQSQTNDLKFFSGKQFLRFVKKRQSHDPLDQLFDGTRSIVAFWEEFIGCNNFLNMLRIRNVVRNIT